jgi:hypothetical protein
LTSKGFLAVALGKDGAPGELVRKFDTRREQTLFIPQFQAAERMSASVAGHILRQIWWWTVSLVSVSCRSVAYKRGLELLKANPPDPLDEFLAYRCFDVVGGVTGRTYRTRLTGPLNVEELDQRGWCVRRLCFFPEDQLVDGDVVLAQKVALETFESEALAIANKVPAPNRYRC